MLALIDEVPITKEDKDSNSYYGRVIGNINTDAFDGDDWKNLETLTRERFNEAKEARNSQQKLQSKIGKPKEEKKPQELYNPSSTHLDKFHNDTDNLTVKTSASRVLGLCYANGMKINLDAHTSGNYDASLQSPISSDPLVQQTISDGEVSVLKGALYGLLNHMRTKKHQSQNQAHTLSLSGSWGACDGCKKRIARFITIWSQEIPTLLKSGCSATLHITYQYLNAPGDFKRDTLTTLYGWSEDVMQQSPYRHSFQVSVTGTAL